MQIQLAANGAEDFQALYIGPDQWSLPGLPGRVVATNIAVAAVTAAGVLHRTPESSDPGWRDVHTAARLLGLTPAQFAAAVGATCVVPDPPLELPRTRRFWPRR